MVGSGWVGHGGLAVWKDAESWYSFGERCGIGRLRAAACAGVMVMAERASRLEQYVHTSRRSQNQSYRVKSRRGVC